MGISIWQILIILLIVLLLFGAGRLPQLMGDMAKGIKTFRSGLKDEDETPPPPRERLAEAPRQDAIAGDMDADAPPTSAAPKRDGTIGG